MGSISLSLTEISSGSDPWVLEVEGGRGICSSFSVSCSSIINWESLPIGVGSSVHIVVTTEWFSSKDRIFTT